MSAFAAHAALDRSDTLGFQTYFNDFAADADILLNIPQSDLAPPLSYQAKKSAFLDFSKLANQTLGDFIAETGFQGLPWFTVDGSLLGSVREKAFLDHDTDIDVGVWASQVAAKSLVL